MRIRKSDGHGRRGRAAGGRVCHAGVGGTGQRALRTAAARRIGDVDLVQTPGRRPAQALDQGLPPGERAFHIHAVGKCEAPFESAGRISIRQPQARHDVRPGPCRRHAEPACAAERRADGRGAQRRGHAGEGQAEFAVRQRRLVDRDPCRSRRLQERSGRQRRRPHRLRRDSAERRGGNGRKLAARRSSPAWRYRGISAQ